MIGNPTCMDCQCLRQTSPEQVFWKCSYWSSTLKSLDCVPDEWRDDPRGYIAIHCHMQPNAPACPMLKPRRPVRAPAA